MGAARIICAATEPGCGLAGAALSGAHAPGFLPRPPERVKPVADAIAGAEFREVESGHFMAIQTPELMSAAVLGFVARL